ncbi:MAG: 2-hydroxyacyl-CoA dehydratase [Planctomycetota bacterium]|jgi:benzoyl-CoA reductase/2-hydroxyglutaryl-CoA dehydratase subunit BcrC/BadD/HgdB
MQSIAYTSPFVPPEWIAAHGLRPSWMRLGSVDGGGQLGLNRGVCPFAAALVDSAAAGLEASAVVTTTVCDQMRYAADVMHRSGGVPVFLMNVPSTWQTATARQLYVEEIQRLGRFLVRLGGKCPSRDELAKVMVRYDRARREIVAGRHRLSARQFAQALAEVRGNGSLEPEFLMATSSDWIPLAVVGGPLLEADYALFDLIEQAGGRVVLDATECGERTLPAPLNPERTKDDPLGQLAVAYFGSIVDVFRRPNAGLYQWLAERIHARRVRGLLFRRYLWCDLWHAELHRLREWSPVPVLDLDAGDQDESATSRTLSRLEAFLETLA